MPELFENPIFLQGAKLVIAIVVLVVAVRLIRAAAARAIADSDMRYRVRKTVSLVGYVAFGIVVVTVFSGQLGSITLIISAASVGIGFALQEVIVSIAGWLALSFGGFYKPGDRVQLGGILGDVIDVGVLRTTLMECGAWVKGDLYTGRLVRVANSFVFKEPVFNYSGEFAFLWDEIVVPVKYGTDHRMARAILERVAAEVVGPYTTGAKEAWADLVRRYRLEDARIEPFVAIVANDNWIELTLRYLVDYRARRVTKDRLFSRILDEIDATGGKVAIASATFQLVEAPPLSIRVERAPRPAD